MPAAPAAKRKGSSGRQQLDATIYARSLTKDRSNPRHCWTRDRDSCFSVASLGYGDLGEEVRRLQEQTIPPGTSMPAHLPKNYDAIGDAPTTMVLAGQLAGDACTLTLSAADAESKQIVAKFSVGPD